VGADPNPNRRSPDASGEPLPELVLLRALSRQYPNLDRTIAAIARLWAELALPKGTVHVISDVHGEDAKLRHIINNASGTLRPLVERLFAAELSPAERTALLTLLFYPRETLESLPLAVPDEAGQADVIRRDFRLVFQLAGELIRRCTHEHLESLLPPDYDQAIQELLYDRMRQRGDGYWNGLLDALLARGKGPALLRLVVRLVRDLAVDELVIAGDCWDRGPRGDRVLDYLMHQPHVSFVWGNHDVSWLGACLGHEALIANVLRISIRYRRLSQLEEGYGITMQPLERLVRTVYHDDPAEHFIPRGSGLRETITMARMQKAAAVLQFKLEGQLIARNPRFQLEHRRLLDRIAGGAVTIAGKTYPLNDRYLPTVDPANPYELSADERACMDRVRQSFVTSQKLWDQCRWLVRSGAMYLQRDNHLIFHGCMPVDDQGRFLAMPVDGQNYSGRALFDALERVLARVMQGKSPADLDLLWYLWCGPISPLFGKDRIATFEIDWVADPATHEEIKNPYFELINNADFCERILAEFDVDPESGLIVNGHVPVRIEKGESPIKRSGKAITIDGAFSEAYGDHGYTLLLEPGQTLLARHHHFESVEAAVRDGVDIIPNVALVRQWPRVRTLGDTEQGAAIRQQVGLLERLAAAYRDNLLRQA